MSGVATSREACDVCAGRVALADVRAGAVTCSQHFLDSLDVGQQTALAGRRVETCESCGWPVVSCHCRKEKA